MIPGVRRLWALAVRPFRGLAAVDQEIAFHLEAMTEELVRAGLDPTQARREAERRFGDLTHYREALMTIDRQGARRRAWHDWWTDAFDDARYALRGLARTPSFAAGVALTLALGLGMTATMVGLVDRLLFKPPAHVAAPERVVRYTLTQTFDTFGTFTNESVTWKEVELMRGARSLDGLAAFALGSASLGRGEQARKVPFMAVTPDYFALLGVHPALGRLFAPGEDPPDGSGLVAVISDRMWSRDFGRNPNVVGTELQLGKQLVTVIGVTPKYFNGIDLDANDVWLPFHAGAKLLAGPTRDWETTWNWQWIHIVARLKSGVTRAGASAEATTMYHAATASDPDRKNDHGFVTYQPVIAGQGDAGEAREPRVAALLAAVSGLLLLITCANVANLLMARGLARGREIAVRLALGVGRGRLVRMLMTETALLTLLAAAGGIGLAYGGGLLTRRWFLPNIDFVEPPVDGRLLFVMSVISVVTALAIGLVPAIRMSRPDLAAELKAGGTGQASAGREHHRVRRALLVMQGALSVVMLIGAGLFVRSFNRVATVDFGFRPDGVLVADMDLSEVGYGVEQRHAFYQTALERFAHYPGIVSASLASANPFYTRSGTSVKRPGGDSVPRLKTGGPYYSTVTPEYFKTMGIAIRRGRGFLPSDGEGGPYVIVVNETLARTFWPGKDPLEQCLFIGKKVDVCRTVVGVAADANSESLEVEPVQAYYVPMAQGADLNKDRTLFLRIEGDAVAAIGGVRKTMQTLAPSLPVADVRLLKSQMDGLYQPWRLGASLFGFMGAIAFIVVLVGLYSVLSYGVAQRQREFGIRTALGASAAAVARLVVMEGQRVVGTGIAIGIAIALLVGPLFQRFLFKTPARDPLTYVIVALLLIAMTIAGSAIPARRAARADPMGALRGD